MSKRKNDVVTAETPAVETAAAPVAKREPGIFVKFNGAICPFGERKPLKRPHAGVAVTIDGKEGTAQVIPARNFDDDRVWVTLGNGKTGRFLVPKGSVVAGAVIETTTETVKYDREAVRVKTETRKKSEVVVATDGEAAEVAEAETAE